MQFMPKKSKKKAFIHDELKKQTQFTHLWPEIPNNENAQRPP
jgi:hypothetical protein